MGAVAILSLPCLVGGAVLLYNAVTGHRIAKWGLLSSLTVALAAYAGMPLLFGAVVVCVASAFRGEVPLRVHAVNIGIIGLSLVSMAALSLVFAGP